MAAIDGPAIPRTARRVGLVALAVLVAFLTFLIALAWFDFGRFRAITNSGWMVLGLVAVIGLFFGSAMIASRQVPERVRTFGEALGIGFVPVGWVLAFYQGRYRELTVRWVPGVDEWDRVVLEHPRPLHLGLYCAFGTSPRDRDLFGRRLVLDDRGLKCLAADESKGTALFRDDPRVRAAVAALEQTGYKFRVDDQTVDLSVDNPPPRTVVDAASELSFALAASAFVNDSPPRPPLRRRVWFRVLFVIVGVLAILAVWAGVMALGIALWGR